MGTAERTSVSGSRPAGGRPRFWVVVPAAGVGSRMQSDRPKQFLQIAGRTILRHTLDRFLEHPRIAGITVAVNPGVDTAGMDLPAPSPTFRQVPGGGQRAESVQHALESLVGELNDEDWVLVHDAARPCLPSNDLDRLLDLLQDDPVGGLLAAPSTDTLKWSESGGRVQRTLDRSRVWRALTPQMFRFGLLRRALAEARDAGENVTDEASAIERLGLEPRLVEGSAVNIKVTRPEDLEVVRAYLEREQRGLKSR